MAVQKRVQEAGLLRDIQHLLRGLIAFSGFKMNVRLEGPASPGLHVPPDAPPRLKWVSCTMR